MPIELKPTSKAERDAAPDQCEPQSEMFVRRLIADIDARDAVLKRLIDWNTTMGYTTLADIAAEARKAVGT